MKPNIHLKTRTCKLVDQVGCWYLAITISILCSSGKKSSCKEKDSYFIANRRVKINHLMNNWRRLVLDFSPSLLQLPVAVKFGTAFLKCLENSLDRIEVVVSTQTAKWWLARAVGTQVILVLTYLQNMGRPVKQMCISKSIM